MTVVRVFGGPPASRAESAKRPKPVTLSQVEMLTPWTHHAYRMAHDGSTLIAHRADGLEIRSGAMMKRSKRVKLDLLAHNPRTLMFSPNNRRVVFWAPVTGTGSKRVAILKVSGSKAGKTQILYTPKPRTNPLGMEWSPKGDALYVLERFWEDDMGYSVVRRIDVKTKKTQEIIRRLGVISFFITPVSRFENGTGESKDPFIMLYGTPEGIYSCDELGGSKRRVAPMPGNGLTNSEWHPTLKKVVVFFPSTVTAADGQPYVGLYLFELEGEGEAKITQLRDAPDVHTMWYSPTGKYMLWANAVEVFFQETKAGGKRRSFAHLDEERIAMPIRGATFNHKETRIAYAVHNQLWVYDMKAGSRYPVAVFAEGFCADPKWVGDDLVVTIYEDIAAELAQRRANPTIKLDCDPGK